ncbi:spermatogenesis-associated protein 31E1-like isoform X1 [Eptesicus fuscus]|uniref:spermatogenesis-associated protein 31E1-like isoform X1 n=1 Tax=Eptesicus fuscus TaxID=29078 RepID=UPI002403BA71|nr:spermatogenesis-associated protein 31E1-like isoform X1 [Eptesicus fuscus]
MENLLCPLKSAIATWQQSSPCWVIDAIVGIVCGVLLFLVCTHCSESDGPSPPPREHRNTRKRSVVPRRSSRSRSRRKIGALKGYRECLQYLEKARELISLLRSHLGRPPDQCGFRQRSHQDNSASQELHDRSTSGGRCQQEPLRTQDPCRRQSKKCVPTEEREGNRRPDPGKHRGGSAALRASQASGMSTAQDQKSAEPVRSQSCQGLWEGQAPAESLFKTRMRHLLQGVLPRKGKGREGPQHRGPPAAATARSWGPGRRRSVMDSRAAEAHVLQTAAGPEEGTALHPGLHAPEVHGHKGGLQAPAGPHLSRLGVLCHGGVARDHHATPSGHNKSGWSTTGDSKGAFPPREPEAPGRHCQHGPRVAGPSGRPRRCPRPCPKARSDSWGRPEHAAHVLPDGTYVQESTFAVYRETLSSCVRPTPASLPLLSWTRTTTTVVTVGWAGGGHRSDK